LIPLHREPKVIHSFLEEIRSGRLLILKVTRSGRNAKYAFLVLPGEIIERYGPSFSVIVHENYVDYVAKETGEYRASRSSKATYKIRFPVDVFGYVIVEPRERGFRVYF